MKGAEKERLGGCASSISSESRRRWKIGQKSVETSLVGSV